MNLKVTENTINTPTYFHRDYKKDIDLKEKAVPAKVDSSFLGMIQRIAFASLPFFSLYKPFSFPLALVMGSVRTFTSTSELFAMMQKKDAQGVSMQMVQTGIAVASLAGTILAHPLGMLITTGQDTLLDAGHLVHALSEHDYKAAAERTLSLVNNTLYLGMFFAGSLELSIASLSIQVLLGLYHSSEDFRNDRWIEGSAHLLMAGIRGHQLSEQVNTLQLKNEFERKMKAFIKQVKEAEKKMREEITSDSPLPTSTRMAEQIVGEKVIKNHSKTITVSHAETSSKDNVIENNSLFLNLANSSTNPELIDVLVKYGNNPDRIPPLHYACKVGDFQSIRILVENSANIDASVLHENKWKTPMHFAIYQGNPEVAKYLFSNGAKTDSDYIAYAAMLERSKMLEFFIESKIALPSDNGKLLYDLLEKHQVNSDIVKMLIKYGADCTYTTNFFDGRTQPYTIGTVAWAASRDRELVELLVENGAPFDYCIPDMSHTRYINWNPLYRAVLQKKYDTAAYLLSQGATVSQAHQKLFHTRAFPDKCNEQVTRELIKLNILNEAIIQEMFDKLVSLNNLSLMKELYEAGAKVHDRHLTTASAIGDRDLIIWLLEHGAKP